VQRPQVAIHFREVVSELFLRVGHERCCFEVLKSTRKLSLCLCSAELLKLRDFSRGSVTTKVSVQAHVDVLDRVLVKLYGTFVSVGEYVVASESSFSSLVSLDFEGVAGLIDCLARIFLEVGVELSHSCGALSCRIDERVNNLRVYRHLSDVVIAQRYRPNLSSYGLGFLFLDLPFDLERCFFPYVSLTVYDEVVVAMVHQRFNELSWFRGYIFDHRNPEDKAESVSDLSASVHERSLVPKDDVILGAAHYIQAGSFAYFGVFYVGEELCKGLLVVWLETVETCLEGGDILGH